jgi:hypothetical protein
VNLVTAWQHEIKEMMGGMGINSIEALKGNRLMLRGVGMTEKELRSWGFLTPANSIFPSYGIITPKLPLTRLRVCAAHAPVLTHRALGTLNHAKRSRCGFAEAASRRHGKIIPKLPLTRLRVCAAHAPVLTHRALETLNHAKPQQVRFAEAAIAA